MLLRREETVWWRSDYRRPDLHGEKNTYYFFSMESKQRKKVRNVLL